MKTLLLLTLCVLMGGAAYAGEVSRSQKEGNIFYEIRYLSTNDKGEVSKSIIRDAEVMRFKKEISKDFGSVDSLLSLDSHVDVEIKEYK